MKHKNSAASWEPADIEQMFKLIESGLSYKEVGKKMGRTADAIRIKYNRLKAAIKPKGKATSKKTPVAVGKIFGKKKKTGPKAKPSEVELELEEEVEPELTHEETLALVLEQKKSDLTIKNDYRIYNELLKKQATIDLITDKMKDAIEAVPAVDIISLKKYKPFKTSGSEEEAVLLLGDLHCGNFVSPDETANLGNYNMELFSERMERLTNSVIEITGLHRKLYPIKKLNVFCLGDLVQGMNNVGQWSPAYIEQDILTQIFVCMQKIEISLITLSKVYEQVDFWGVVGNHGRAAKRGAEKDYVNWDYIMYVFLEKSLSNYPNIKFHVDKSWMQIAEIQQKKFMLVHGDDIKGWAGIPFYGIQRAESRYRTLLEQFKNPAEAIHICRPYLEKLEKNPTDTQAHADLIQAVMLYAKSFDHLVIGHFHTPGTLPINSGGKIFINGSFYGGDNYSLKTIQSANPPIQKFFGVHKKGVSWQYDLELERD